MSDTSSSAGALPPAVPNDPDRLLTLAEVCEVVRMCPRWVRDQVKTGTFPHLRLGKKLLFRRSSVLAWCAHHEKGDTPG